MVSTFRRRDAERTKPAARVALRILFGILDLPSIQALGRRSGAGPRSLEPGINSSPSAVTLMTTTNAASTSGRQIALASLFADLDEEFGTTRRVLERYPDEHADWRPHQKSMSLAQLAAHVASLPHFGELIAQSPEFDFAKTPYVAPTARTRAEILELFDENAAAAREAIDSLDADSLQADWTLRAGDTVYASGPRFYHIRRAMLSHIVHHRAQLTVYYRLLDIPVPGTFGPSADEG